MAGGPDRGTTHRPGRPLEPPGRVIRRLTRRAGRHVGRRGAFLLFLAELDLAIAYSLVAPLPYGLSAAQLYQPFTRVAPISVWAWWWAATAVLCGTAAVWHQARPVAFGAAALLKSVWGTVYLVAWVSGALIRGWLSTTIWLTFAGILLLVSSWREHGQ